eukprot:1369103-Heterocapsa_arctica.AAC.1
MAIRHSIAICLRAVLTSRTDNLLTLLRSSRDVTVTTTTINTLENRARIKEPKPRVHVGSPARPGLRPLAPVT